MDICRFQKNITFLVWIIFLILTRLLPHLPNSAPIFCVTLFLSFYYSKNNAIFLGLTALLITDIILGVLNHYPMFGWWSFFTYSGFIISLLCGASILTSRVPLILKTFSAVISSTFFFWVWTNFGTWLITALYPKTVIGLVTCFIAAIPFLNNALLGQILWGIVIFTALSLFKQKSTGLQNAY